MTKRTFGTAIGLALWIIIGLAVEAFVLTHPAFTGGYELECYVGGVQVECEDLQ